MLLGQQLRTTASAYFMINAIWEIRGERNEKESNGYSAHECVMVSLPVYEREWVEGEVECESFVG